MTDKRLYHSIADKIVTLIRDGAFPPGSRLPGERELAGRFKVSRVTIREAEIALQALGFVNIKTGSGVYVLAPPEKDYPGLPHVSPFELTEARLLFESEAAALAARHITKEALDRLEHLVTQIAFDNPKGEDASQRADREFHLTIAEASGNAAVQYVIETLWRIRNEMPTVRGAHQAVCGVEDATNRQKEHAAVLDALRSRDPKLARKAMQGHFTRLLEAMIDITEEKALEDLRRKSTESRQRYLSSVIQPQSG